MNSGQRSFDVVRRGYDIEQVEQFLIVQAEAWSSELGLARTRMAAMEEELRRLSEFEAEADALRQRVQAIELERDEFTKSRDDLLEQAQQEAQRLKAETQLDIAKQLHDAEIERARIESEVRERTEKLSAEAEQERAEASRLAAEAQTVTSRAIDSAETKAMRILNDARAEAERVAANGRSEAANQAEEVYERQEVRLNSRRRELDESYIRTKSQYDRVVTAMSAKVTELKSTHEALITGLQAIAKGGLSQLPGGDIELPASVGTELDLAHEEAASRLSARSRPQPAIPAPDQVATPPEIDTPEIGTPEITPAETTPAMTLSPEVQAEEAPAPEAAVSEAAPPETVDESPPAPPEPSVEPEQVEIPDAALGGDAEPADTATTEGATTPNRPWASSGFRPAPATWTPPTALDEPAVAEDDNDTSAVAEAAVDDEPAAGSGAADDEYTDLMIDLVETETETDSETDLLLELELEPEPTDTASHANGTQPDGGPALDQSSAEERAAAPDAPADGATAGEIEGGSTPSVPPSSPPSDAENSSTDSDGSPTHFAPPSTERRDNGLPARPRFGAVRGGRPPSLLAPLASDLPGPNPDELTGSHAPTAEVPVARPPTGEVPETNGDTPSKTAPTSA